MTGRMLAQNRVPVFDSRLVSCDHVYHFLYGSGEKRKPTDSDDVLGFKGLMNSG